MTQEQLDTYLHTPLTDDDSPYGGISFEGECLLDFLEECNLATPTIWTISKKLVRGIDATLESNGIEPIGHNWVHLW